MFKSFILLTVAAVSILAAAGPEPNINTYSISGTVTGPDEIITADGNIWGYDSLPAIGSPVWVTLADPGTPEDPTDDQMLKVQEAGIVVKGW